nr:DUF1799 domain-containing protein [uncultured Janthinobacterium sp.]
MTLDDVATEPVDVWPENVQAFHLFGFLSTQWRTSMSGPSGLDYGVLFHKMDRMSLSTDEYVDLELQIQIMEEAALRAIHAPK